MIYNLIAGNNLGATGSGWLSTGFHIDNTDTIPFSINSFSWQIDVATNLPTLPLSVPFELICFDSGYSHYVMAVQTTELSGSFNFGGGLMNFENSVPLLNPSACYVNTPLDSLGNPVQWSGQMTVTDLTSASSGSDLSPVISGIGNLNFGIVILVVLAFIGFIGYVFNLMKKKKAWH